MATCIISGTVLDLDGTPNSDVQIIAVLEQSTIEDDLSGQLVGSDGVTIKQIEAFTEDDGTFEITLLQTARVLLSIPSIQLRKVITVPATATANLEDLI